MNYFDISLEEVKAYSKIDHDEEDQLIETFIPGCKSFLLSYTGLTVEEANNIPDIKIVLLALCNDCYEHRGLVADTLKQVLKNPMIDIILNMHMRNGIG